MADETVRGVDGDPIVHKGDKGYQHSTAVVPPDGGLPGVAPQPPKEPESDPDNPADSLKGSEFLDKVFGPKPEEPEEPAATQPQPQPKPRGRPKKAEEPKEPGEPKEPEEPGEPKEPEEPSAPTAEDIARAATTAATEAVLNASKGKEEEEVQVVPEHPELPPEHQEFAELYAELAEMNPKKYGKIFDKIKEFGEKEAAYIDKWREENPGDDFDPESTEHRNWYARNEFKIDPLDNRRAERALTKREIKREMSEEYNKELAPIKQKMRVQELQATVGTDQRKVAQEMIKAVVPDQKDFSKEALDKIGETDKIAGTTIMEVVPAWMGVIESARLLRDEAVPFDDTNQTHTFVANMLGELEHNISSLPPAERMHGGKQFAALATYTKMSKKDQAKHWAVSSDALVEYVGSVAKREIAKRKQFWEQKAKELGASPSNNGRTQAKSTPAPRPARNLGSAAAPQRGVIGSPDAEGGGEPAGVERFFANIGLT